MSIARNLCRLRQQSGLGHADFARLIGTTPNKLRQWEVGWSEPNMGQILRIMRALRVSRSDVIGHHS